METSSLVTSRAAGRSRFSKALPTPPAEPRQVPLRKPLSTSQLFRPVRKDSLPSRPALPPKDNTPASIPSDMTAKVMNAPLPALPPLTRVNSPPNVIPRRKPVGGGASIKTAKSPPPPQPIRSGEISPTDSFSSLLSAYGTEDSGARYSVDTAATKHSFAEPSPPKLPPKDSLVTGTSNKLEIVSPLSLPTPLHSKSSKMVDTGREQRHYYGTYPGQQQSRGPPSPPTKDNQGLGSPQNAKLSLDTSTTSPTSVSEQSPSKPQIWRRRSLKSDKPLAVSELKLTVSHGSTASPQQVTSLVNTELSAQNTGRRPLNDTRAEDSPAVNGFGGNLTGRNVRPSPSQKSLPRNPSPEKSTNKKSNEALDGFSQYAQGLDQRNSSSSGKFKTPQYSPAKMSPEDRRPPTPEYAKDEAQHDGAGVHSPTSPMTPPQDNKLQVQGDEMRPLSIIQEDVDPTKAAASPAPSGPLPSLPVRSPSSPDSAQAAAAPRQLGGLPRSPRPRGSSPNLTASAPSAPEKAALSPSPIAAHQRSTSSASIPTISVSDDGASTIKATSPQPAADAGAAMPPAPLPQQYQHQHQQQQHQQQPQAIFHARPATPESPTSARPGNPAYFPMRHYLAKPVAPGTVLAAPGLTKAQVECFAGHYRFVPSRNEEHPLACATCAVRDNGARLACSFCALRVCKDCCDVLMLNGKDVGRLVEMLKA